MTIERSTTKAQPTNRSQAQSLGLMVAFDIAAPLATYYLLRADGLSSVVALVVSGVFPFVWVSLGFVRHRRFDAVGGLVLAGIVAGVILGLASGNARLVVIEGSLPTGVFGLYTLGSLFSQRPMMFRFPLQAMGADTPRGRAFAELWRYAYFRRGCRIITAVWGPASSPRQRPRPSPPRPPQPTPPTASPPDCPSPSSPLIVWTMTYSKRRQHEGERRAASPRSEGGRPTRSRDGGAIP